RSSRAAAQARVARDMPSGTRRSRPGRRPRRGRADGGRRRAKNLSWLGPAAKRDEIDLLAARFLLALHFEECEGPQRLGARARAQRAKRLAELAVLLHAVHGDQRIERMLRER